MATDPLSRIAPVDLPEADRVEALDRVLVCGAGPVGLVAALSLARDGVPVTVIEKGPDLSLESRASTFHPPTLEILDGLGMADPIIERGLRAPTTQFRDRTIGPVATFDLGVLANETEFPFRIQLEQNKAARLILERLQAGTEAGEWDVDIRFEHRTHAVLRTGDGKGNGNGPADANVERVIVGTATEFVEIRAPWVIGAEGAHSAVRSSLGIELVGETYPEEFLVVSVADDLTEMLDDLSFVNYVADPDQWLVLLKTPDHWRVLFPVQGHLDEASSDEGVLKLLDGVVDRGGEWDLLQWSQYVVSRCVAHRMRDGRALLAGDAAHQNSPLGGMGMNSGIQDAASAARRLARVWHGDAGDEVLDEYDANRRRIATQYVQTDSHANWLALREPDPAKRAELQAELRDIAADPERHRERMMRTAMLDAVRDSL
jgi:2-polyprenyl-6-methoxyphenol hydroxylase-like FAD-dependent oxidoreductase